MDKLLLNRVKSILLTSSPENVDRVRKSLMLLLKPEQADEVYEYFIRIEPGFIEENCKVKINEIIPVYSDYYKSNDVINDIFFDDYNFDE
jgi:hypothetical protein